MLIVIIGSSPQCYDCCSSVIKAQPSYRDCVYWRSLLISTSFIANVIATADWYLLLSIFTFVHEQAASQISNLWRLPLLCSRIFGLLGSNKSVSWRNVLWHVASLCEPASTDSQSPSRHRSKDGSGFTLPHIVYSKPICYSGGQEWVVVICHSVNHMKWIFCYSA